MCKKQLFVLGLLFITSLASADTEVYKWTDLNGGVHYSDVPRAGAAAVQLPQESVSRSSVGQTQAQAAAQVNVAPLPPPHAYTKVSITEPVAESTSVNNEDGSMVVEVSMQPTLHAGDKIQLRLDGKPAGIPQASSSLRLKGIERGKHTLQAEIMDSKGKVLASSQQVTIFMQRPRTL